MSGPVVTLNDWGHGIDYGTHSPEEMAPQTKGTFFVFDLHFSAEIC